jgi:hypothetical protein
MEPLGTLSSQKKDEKKLQNRLTDNTEHVRVSIEIESNRGGRTPQNNREKDMFLVIGQNVWGRGETEELAHSKASKANGSKLKRYQVYESADPEVAVSDEGYIVTRQDCRAKLVKLVDGKFVTICE